MLIWTIGALNLPARAVAISLKSSQYLIQLVYSAMC